MDCKQGPKVYFKVTTDLCSDLMLRSNQFLQMVNTSCELGSS